VDLDEIKDHCQVFLKFLHVKGHLNEFIIRIGEKQEFGQKDNSVMSKNLRLIQVYTINTFVV